MTQNTASDQSLFFFFFFALNCMQFQIILSEKNKKYNKLSAVEVAMGKLIQLYLVGVGEFSLYAIQCKKEKKKKKKKKSD